MKTIPALFPIVGGQEEVPLSRDLILHSQVKKKEPQPTKQQQQQQTK